VRMCGQPVRPKIYSAFTAQHLLLSIKL
jgi:hypothetical protein